MSNINLLLWAVALVAFLAVLARDRQDARAESPRCEGCGAPMPATPGRKTRRFHSHNCYLKHLPASAFEAQVYALLEAAGLPLERQSHHGRWSFDGYVTGTPILFEADGGYWHDRPAAKRRDRRKDAWCKRAGFTLFRVPEDAFRISPEAAVAPIIAAYRVMKGQL